MKQIIEVLLLLFSISAEAQNLFLNKQERVYSLSMIWKELEYNFAFPDKLKKANLDSLYFSYLEKVEHADDEYEYYRTLSSFMAHFEEAHTRIIPPENAPYDMPPLVTSNIGKHIFIKNIAKKLSEKMPLGSEIIAVNDVPVIDYLKDSVYQYISAATQHWKFDKAVMEMLYGRPFSKVSVTIKPHKGESRKVELIRDYYAGKKTDVMADTTYVPPLEIKYLKGGIGYLCLSTCVGSKLAEIQSTFYDNLKRLIQCKGLIVDVRGNRGGTDQAWHPIAYCCMPGREFSDKGKWITREHIASYKLHGDSDMRLKDYFEGKAMKVLGNLPYKNRVPDSLRLNQPMIVLSGKYVGSAAEDFVILMKENKRATIIGEPTVGCIGEPTFVDLSGGYTVMISCKAYVAEDDSQPNDTGILPDLEVKQDYEAYQRGRDNQLDTAISELREMMK